jgi:hypothetical protein
MGYNPDKPMEDRITDIGPPHYVASGCTMKLHNPAF